jgi:hypothetical protein
MMIKKALVLVFLVCSLMFIGTVNAVDDGVDSYFNPDENSTAIPTPTPGSGFFNLSVVQSINPKGVPMSFPLFAPAEITLSYAEAQNYYVNFTSYDTSHSESQSPYGMSVSLFGVGTYMFSFNVYYSKLVNQSVTLALKSGNSSFPISISLSSCNQGFVLDVVIVTSQEPYFPTKDEIADATYNQQKALMENMSKNVRDSQAFTNIVIAVISAVVVVVVIVLAVVVIWARRTDRRQISQKYHGFGNGR